MNQRANPSKNAQYYEITKNNPPSPLLISAIALLSHKKTALDLGCGAGRDTRYLLDQGFEVTSVDVDAETEVLIGALPHQDKVRYVNAAFSDFVFDHYDVVNAQWSLPFTSPEKFNEVMEKLKESINPGGVFTGQLFGVHDEWNKPHTNMTFHTKEQAQTVFDGMEIIRLNEKEIDSTTASGTPKHWHVFHIIAKKPIE